MLINFLYRYFILPYYDWFEKEHAYKDQIIEMVNWSKSLLNLLYFNFMLNDVIKLFNTLIYCSNMERKKLNSHMNQLLNMYF